MSLISGSHGIAKMMGCTEDYIKVSVLLNFLDIPKTINNKGVATYCLTEEHVNLIKETFSELKRKLRGNFNEGR